VTDKDTELKKLSSRLRLIGIAAFDIAPLAYFSFVQGRVSNHAADWGTFGDFVGGIAGTAIALVTLIALVGTLRLQAKELEETRQALQDQAKSARDQIYQSMRFEERRVQPILKTEWHPDGGTGFTHWVMTNVGLGPCILDQLDLYWYG